MMVHPTDGRLRLLTLEDVRSDSWQHVLPWRTAPFYLAAAWWVETFVCGRNPGLGRDGYVCPFVRTAIDRQLFWLTGHEAGIEGEDLAEVLLAYRNWFEDLPPKAENEGVFKAIAVVVPAAQSEDGFATIEATQKLLKPEFVSRGLMLGQFYSTCDEPGLRRDEFRPLRSPVPMLVIRHATRFDLPFLTDPRYLPLYRERFGDDVPERLQNLYEAALQQAGVRSAETEDLAVTSVDYSRSRPFPHSPERNKKPPGNPGDWGLSRPVKDTQ